MLALTITFMYVYSAKGATPAQLFQHVHQVSGVLGFRV